MNFLFLFATDWNHEIASYERGEVPAHRLFGLVDVQRQSHAACVCKPPPIARGFLRRPMVWRTYQALCALFQQGRHDVVFAVNEASALPVLALKKLGLLRTPVIVFCTGLMHARNRTGKRKAMWRWLLPAAEAVVSQTSMELESTWREFGLRQDRQFLIHMLVDTHFFRPGDRREKGDFCLAAGTNEGRDYVTLLRAFPADQRLVVVTDAGNAAIIARHVAPGARVEVRQAVPMLELKALYEQARVIINPLAEIAYCSGHTTLLENMALGHPVIISAVSGMRDYVEDGATALTVRPGDVDDLREKITRYLAAPERFAAVGQQAAARVERFSTEAFAGHLIRLAERLVAPSPLGAATAPQPSTLAR
ncbi:MAG: glycosyltransferase family 4 protein [Gluconacetobacter diazotrophicus]|nr:glycosyltransferase family 4 protein [Gluconacetobacter diazotrophicus]